MISVILTPISNPDVFIEATSLLKPSMISMNMRGDKGQPCLKTLSAWKKFEEKPLISIMKATDVTQHMIQFMKGCGKPM